MKARPILMSSPMVRALLEGRKTQTRRIVKAAPECPVRYDGIDDDDLAVHWWEELKSDSGYTEHYLPFACPYGKPGDLLWVRETIWLPPVITDRMMREGADTWPEAIYDEGLEHEWCREHGWRKRPSIHMPRWASRLTLELTEVRVERLQDISEADALAEGIERLRYPERGDWGVAARSLP